MTNTNDSGALGSSVENVDSDNFFDQFLQDQLQITKPYLEDDNFSARLMASLPVAKKGIGWRQRLLVLLPIIMISILVLTQNSLLAFVIKSWVMLSILSIDSLFKIIVEVSLVALLGVGCWFAKQCRLF